MEDKNNKINKCLEETFKYFKGLKPRDPKRIDNITNKLNELWHTSPDLRFGQLIHMIKHMENLPEDDFNVEDDKWLDAIEKVLNERKE